MPALRRADGSQRSGAGNSLAAQPVLGLPALRAALLDDLPLPARRSGRGRSRAAQTRGRITLSFRRMNTSPDSDDEDDEILEDEEFDEDGEFEEDDEDFDPDADEDDETWQVVAA